MANITIHRLRVLVCRASLIGAASLGGPASRFIVLSHGDGVYDNSAFVRDDACFSCHDVSGCPNHLIGHTVRCCDSGTCDYGIIRDHRAHH